MARKVRSVAGKVRSFMQSNPDAKVRDVATKFGVTVQYVYGLRYLDRKKQKAPEPVQAKPVTPPSDPVNHPAHYKTGGIETIDFIEAKSLNYNLGNVVKYITRSDHKGNKEQDLLKAAWYLQREIEHALGARQRPQT
jgi:hypothetical protein